MFDYLDILIQLALIRLKYKEIKVSTKILALQLKTSQQTISRKLQDMENKNLIERELIKEGQKIKILPKGRKLLKRVYQTLKKINQEIPQGISFGGYVINGSGEGKYYINLKNYAQQFYKKLKYKPYPGTLNLKIKSIEDIKEKNKLQNLSPIVINGFKEKNRSYGRISCYPCKINNKVKGALIIPERTHHNIEIVELISPFCLRKKLSLKNNDYVTIEII